MNLRKFENNSTVDFRAFLRSLGVIFRYHITIEMAKLTKRETPQGLLAALLTLIVLLQVGCQGGSNTSKRGLFDSAQRPKLFGNDSIFSSKRGAQDRYAADVPDIQIDDGSVAGNRVGQLSERLGAYDSDNQLLNTEVAGLQYKLDLANQYSQQLKEQLASTTNQMSQVFAERETAEQKNSGMKIQLDQLQQNLQLAQQRAQQSINAAQLASSPGNVPTQLAPSATIRANNSLLDKLSLIQIQGAEARMDGDVIRIEFPIDRTFVPGTYQIQPAQFPLLQNISATVQRSFPRQIVVVESHWDNSSLGDSGISDHQLTATQSLAIFNEFIRLGLPNRQLFAMAMGSNRPRHPAGIADGISPNRRIEIVIYPETYDAN